MATPSLQFERCEICRLNHTKQKAHVYSKQHQKIVKNVLIKFGKKVTFAKADKQSPHIEDHSWEIGATFWCYFCGEEWPKNTPLGDVTVRYGGLMHHIASVEHKEKAVAFFRTNHIPKDKMLKFIISEDDLKSFQCAAEKNAQRYLTEKKEQRLKVAEKIKHQEVLRKRIYHHHLNMSHIPSKQGKHSPTPDHQMKSRNILPGMPVQPVRTIGARGEGLTCIPIPVFDKTVGNIYTSDLPPWERTDLGRDDTEEKKRDIGPTMEDFQKHLHNETKSKLPPMRVGAKFKASDAMGDAWLPSFGRVWSKGSREHTRKQFMKSQASAAVSKPSTSDLPSDPMLHSIWQEPSSHGESNHTTLVEGSSASKTEPEPLSLHFNFPALSHGLPRTEGIVHSDNSMQSSNSVALDYRHTIYSQYATSESGPLASSDWYSSAKLSYTSGNGNIGHQQLHHNSMVTNNIQPNSISLQPNGITANDQDSVKQSNIGYKRKMLIISAPKPFQRIRISSALLNNQTSLNKR